MLEAKGLLNAYLHILEQISQAKNVVLFLPAATGGLARGWLSQTHHLASIPELANEQVAEQFIDQQMSGQTSDNDCNSHALFRPLPSLDSHCQLYQVSLYQAQLICAELECSEANIETAAFKYLNPAQFCWLGLRFEENAVAANKPQQKPYAFVKWLATLTGILAVHANALLTTIGDPLTQLLGRPELHNKLENLLLSNCPFMFLLINPDNFNQINQRLGRNAGDQVLSEIAKTLTHFLSRPLMVGRYGGAHFAAILLSESLASTKALAQELLQHLAKQPYLNNSVHLTFNIGLAGHWVDGQLEHTDARSVMLHADEALSAARLKGQGNIQVWHDKIVAKDHKNADRLRGIFTATEAKNYRNMLLLWDLMALLSEADEFQSLLTQFVNRLFQTFEPSHLYVYLQQHRNLQMLIAGQILQGNKAITLPREHGIHPGQQAVINECYRSPRVIQETVTIGSDGKRLESYVFPLMAKQKYLGCLYFDGSATNFQIDESDRILLKSLTCQLGMTLERMLLETEAKNNQQQQWQLLREELKELRLALQYSNLVYRSNEMKQLLLKVKKVAVTDASVLIVGESGTGKELLARTLHALSPQGDKPFVVIDCGAIPDALTESELFGHEKGAFTGAERVNRGRIIEAAGGTLVLDEIGEIPLLVQSKLLRFVQEKQFTPVGGSSPQSVDVRLVAITNRDLAKEVAEGRFREDLYFRLNVVEIKSPPLRERPADILYLSQHFLTKYSVQYQKPIRHLSQAAEASAIKYHWPGNVRELQNRVMQAVIFSETVELSPQDLSFDLTLKAVENDTSGTVSNLVEFAIRQDGDPWQQLDHLLDQQIQLTISQPSIVAMPLGNWLSEDLVLAAYKISAQVSRQAAARLGIPESTFRRKLKKIHNLEAANLAQRTAQWQDVQQLLSVLVEQDEQSGFDLIKRIQTQLLQQILRRLPQNVSTAAQLMGVCDLTFKKLAS